MGGQWEWGSQKESDARPSVGRGGGGGAGGALAKHLKRGTGMSTTRQASARGPARGGETPFESASDAAAMVVASRLFGRR